MCSSHDFADPAPITGLSIIRDVANSTDYLYFTWVKPVGNWTEIVVCVTL